MLAILLASSCAFAQTPTEQDPYPMPQATVLNEPPAAQPAPQPALKSPARPPVRPAARPAKPSPAIAARPASAPNPPSLLSQAPQPAKVSLAAGKLAIVAHNSSLSAILRQIAKAGGMKIDSLPANASAQRIFGRYGPGTPRDVLTDLLTGSGYNVIMAGLTPAGTPRQLALSPRAAGSTPNPPAPPTDAEQEQDNQDESQPPQYPEEQQEVEQEEQRNQPPPPNEPNRVKTPEQILQELQRMRQQSQQPH